MAREATVLLYDHIKIQISFYKKSLFKSTSADRAWLQDNFNNSGLDFDINILECDYLTGIKRVLSKISRTYIVKDYEATKLVIENTKAAFFCMGQDFACSADETLEFYLSKIFPRFKLSGHEKRIKDILRPFSLGSYFLMGCITEKGTEGWPSPKIVMQNTLSQISDIKTRDQFDFIYCKTIDSVLNKYAIINDDEELLEYLNLPENKEALKVEMDKALFYGADRWYI